MLALKAELNEPLADAYVSRLWSWTQVYAPSGRFPAAIIHAVETELLWTRSAGSLAAALEKCGWLDRDGSDVLVHDWPEMQGYLVKKARKDADKKRKRRERASARTGRGQNAPSTRDSERTAPPTDVTDGRNGRTDLFGAARENETDPRHAPLVKALVDAYMRKRGADGYPGFNGKHAKLVTRLLAARPATASADLWPVRLLAAWERALDDRYPECSTLEEFEKKLPKYIGTPADAKPDAPESRAL
jgi:hypothetical protein